MSNQQIYIAQSFHYFWYILLIFPQNGYYRFEVKIDDQVKLSTGSWVVHEFEEVNLYLSGNKTGSFEGYGSLKNLWIRNLG